VFVNIKPHWERKLAALRAYRQELRPWPHARSLEAIENLGRWRGASAGVEMAEAFMLVRDIVR
jgi:LmbE family N-acetylglucosaminyl deacetylase